jgi:hypothetical protein
LSTAGRLGFDLEVLNPHRDFAALAAALMPAGAGMAQMSGFYEAWCRREAEIKLGAAPAAVQTMQWRRLQLALALAFSAAPCLVQEAAFT